MKEAFLFGFTLAIAVGPIAILIFNQTINCGLKTGIFSALGAASADLTYAILTFSSGGISATSNCGIRKLA
jgi:threonine/homoserine/homoserine lactone efflux protein